MDMHRKNLQNAMTRLGAVESGQIQIEIQLHTKSSMSPTSLSCTT